MTPRDLPAKRLAVLEETAHGTAPVAVYGGDLRALLAMRRLLLAAHPLDITEATAKRLENLAGRTVSSGHVRVAPVDVRTLLAVRRSFLARRRDDETDDAKEQAALAAAGARAIKRGSTLVGPDHGKDRPTVRTYGFDLAHLASFLDMHPETVRQAIRSGELLPTSLDSIYKYKLARSTGVAYVRPLLTTEDVAKATKLSVEVVRSEARRGALVGSKFGRALRFTNQQVKDWITTRQTSQEDPT